MMCWVLGNLGWAVGWMLTVIRYVAVITKLTVAVVAIGS